MTEVTSARRRHHCEFETPFEPSSGLLDGTISITTTEIGVDDKEVVFQPETLLVDVEWTLTGSLAHLICGEWCVCVDFECFGAGPNFDFDKCRQVKFDCNNKGKYKETFRIKVSDYPQLNDKCTSVCRLVATVSLLDSCGNPSRIAGFCQGPLIQFSPATN